MLHFRFAFALVLPALAVASSGTPIKPNRTVLFHSHNDYLRSEPVYDAIDHGIQSVESDLWWDAKSKEFYVAHTALTIDHSKTFQSVTLDRVMRVLNGSHTGGDYDADSAKRFLDAAASKATSDPDWYHYYAHGFGGVRPIQILVEIKSNDGETSWPQVVSSLELFRKRGWLTRYENGKIHYGPIIVVGTGGTPFEQIAPQRERDVFWDCSLGGLDGTTKIDGIDYGFNSTVCPMSSTNFIDVAPPYVGLTPAPSYARKHFHADVKQAHKHRTTTRFYGVVEAPASAKYDDYNMLIEQGSDWLNLDDVHDAAKYTDAR